MPVIGEPPISRRKAVAAYVFAANIAAYGCGAAMATGHDYGPGIAFGIAAVLLGAIAVLVGGPPPK